jgi:RNA polymerase sigma factor (sigma-70 family)
MSSPFHVLWQKLFPSKRLLQNTSRSVHKRAYLFEFSLQQAVQELAARDGRPEDEVASDLLASGLALRRQADYYVQAWTTLTAREKQIAVLLCRDTTYRQIADDLNISPETVKAHVHNILTKLELRNKLDLIRALGNWDFSEWNL